MHNNDLHVAILSSPGAGHLIPVLVLANRLAAAHGVRSTVLVTATAADSPDSNHVGLPLEKELVEIIHLPPVDISHLVDPSTKVVTQLCFIMREVVPLVRDAVAAIRCRVDALIVDLFGTESLKIATELSMPKYVFCTGPAWFMALSVYCPVLHEQVTGQYVDEPGPLEIPGCKPVRPEDVVGSMLDRDDQQYREYLRMGKEFPLSDGILINTQEDLEPKTIQALNALTKKPVYPIGPLTRPAGSLGGFTEEWLNEQPSRSVLYVSFGSGGILSAEQITELAWGLELSRHKFIWVIRPPTKGGVDDAFFAANNGEAGESYLPKGFLDRTKNVGVLVTMWGPQAEILAHSSVGGFLSHCGWNSTAESLTSGVPMIAWPLYAEQRLNAALLAEELRVAVRTEVLPTKKVVEREEIERLVRSVMGDQEMRDRVVKLKTTVVNGLTEGGSSYNSMCDVLSDIAAKKEA